MAIKFPLKMANEALVRTIEELRENFDIVSVLTYYNDGRLIKWLENGYYDMEAKKITELDSTSKTFNNDLCEILGINDYHMKSSGEVRAIAEKCEKREKLKLFTLDDAILENIDCVAFDQKELANLLDKGEKIIYLCGEEFAIAAGMENITYIGVNYPLIYVPNDFPKENCKDVEFLNNVLLENNEPGETTNMIYRAKVATNENIIKFWSNLAKEGSAVAQLEVADAYWLGKGVEEDEEEAYKWYYASAKQGNAVAQFFVGLLYYDGDGPEGQDYKKAGKWFLKAAKQGDCDAQHYLGLCYQEGKGVKENHYKAIQWFLKAAAQEFSNSMIEIAEYYAWGIVVEQDFDMSFKWSMKVLEAEDDLRAKEICLSIAKAYFYGSELYVTNVEQEYHKAFKYFYELAEIEHEESQYYLYQCYNQGLGVEKDEEEAIRWLYESAEAGYAEAQYQLGEWNWGFEKDYCSLGIEEYQSFMWFRRAAKQGHMEAKKRLDELSKVVGHFEIQEDSVEQENGFSKDFKKDMIQNTLKNCLSKSTSIDYKVTDFSREKLGRLMHEMTFYGESVEDIAALLDPSVKNVITEEVSGILFTCDGFYFRRKPTTTLYFMRYEDIESVKRPDKLFEAWLEVRGYCVRGGFEADRIKMQGISYDQDDLENVFKGLRIVADAWNSCATK